MFEKSSFCTCTRWHIYGTGFVSHTLLFDHINRTSQAFASNVQVKGVLISRRGDLEGVDDQTVDMMVKGVDAWISAATHNLMQWCLMVFTKPVRTTSDH